MPSEIGKSSDATPALSLRRVGKRFGDMTVLSDIDLDVGKGEIVALLGASGSGKSTLLNIVAGLLAPDGGTLAYDGIASARVDRWREIAYMFQDDRLLPWRTARDNVAFGLEAQRLDKASRRARAEAALTLVGLQHAGDAYPHEMSGGMRSRAALARSLVVAPSILLMDEPFSKLDPQTRTSMHQEVLRIQAMQGTTVLFVTHDVEEAVVLANRIVVLTAHPGRIKAIHHNTLSAPRNATSPVVAEVIRALRLEI
ncbi:nitrate ABC transporter ATPase [Robbsia andropogonis]|uniref:Nitrate ABC transporter ATPase n=1 Tax=Robbsia andropogonis TaxID=28092 RepID=A0A0F5K1D5_9BURK|nr:nitrate ABC transporter ATPase [Robbsia andropogonis]